MSELYEIPQVTPAHEKKKPKKVFVSFISEEKCNKCGENYECGKIIQFDSKREIQSLYIACLGDCISGVQLMRGCELLDETEKRFTIPKRNYVLFMNQKHEIQEQNFTAMVMEHIEKYAANMNYNQVHACQGYNEDYCSKCDFADKCEEFKKNQKII